MDTTALEMLSELRDTTALEMLSELRDTTASKRCSSELRDTTAFQNEIDIINL